MVIVKAAKDLPRPVTWAECKANRKLKNMSLVTSFRLSVQPVTDAEWKAIEKMSRD